MSMLQPSPTLSRAGYNANLNYIAPIDAVGSAKGTIIRNNSLRTQERMRTVPVSPTLTKDTHLSRMPFELSSNDTVDAIVASPRLGRLKGERRESYMFKSPPRFPNLDNGNPVVGQYTPQYSVYLNEPPQYSIGKTARELDPVPLPTRIESASTTADAKVVEPLQEQKRRFASNLPTANFRSRTAKTEDSQVASAVDASYDIARADKVVGPRVPTLVHIDKAAKRVTLEPLPHTDRFYGEQSSPRAARGHVALEKQIARSTPRLSLTHKLSYDVNISPTKPHVGAAVEFDKMLTREKRRRVNEVEREVRDKFYDAAGDESHLRGAVEFDKMSPRVPPAPPLAVDAVYDITASDRVVPFVSFDKITGRTPEAPRLAVDAVYNPVSPRKHIAGVNIGTTISRDEANKFVIKPEVVDRTYAPDINAVKSRPKQTVAFGKRTGRRTDFAHHTAAPDVSYSPRYHLLEAQPSGPRLEEQSLNNGDIGIRRMDGLSMPSSGPDVMYAPNFALIAPNKQAPLFPKAELVRQVHD